MSKHTPEPWAHFIECCEPATPHPDSDGFVGLGFDDYERARACVNACSGMEDPSVFIAGLKSELSLATHKLLACGVAARHPDASLSRRESDYGGKWNSPQAEYVRQLRQQRDELLSELEGIHLVASLSSMTHNMLLICNKSAAAVAKAKGGAA